MAATQVTTSVQSTQIVAGGDRNNDVTSGLASMDFGDASFVWTLKNFGLLFDSESATYG